NLFQGAFPPLGLVFGPGELRRLLASAAALRPLRSAAAPRLAAALWAAKLRRGAAELRRRAREVAVEPKKLRLLLQMQGRLERLQADCERESQRPSERPTLGSVTSCESEVLVGFRALIQDPCWQLRRVAIAGLSCLGPLTPCGALLAEVLQRDHSAEVRCAAADGIAVLLPHGDRAALTALSQALKDRCPHVCARAMAAMATVHSADVLSSTAPLLQDEDRFVRARVVATLGRLGVPAAPLLAARCEDRNEHAAVRMMAQSSLQRIHLTLNEPQRLALTCHKRTACSAEKDAKRRTFCLVVLSQKKCPQESGHAMAVCLLFL
ncbi:unnamed protein product, partial [Effrenium voratum]